VIFYKAGIPDTKTAKESIIRFIDSLIYEKGRKSSEAYSATQEILNSAFQDFGLQIEFRGLDRNKEVLFRNSLTEKIRTEDLSDGKQELITKAFFLYLADIRDSVILIDEPESSLHPDWQNLISQIYQNVADRNNNQVILKYLAICFQVSAYEEQLFHCEPRMNADERGRPVCRLTHPRSSVFIRGL